MVDALTSTQAARLAGVTPSTLNRWADLGRLPFRRTAGGHRRFDRADVDRMIAQQRHGPSPSNPPTSSPLTSDWVDTLVSGRRYAVDAKLLDARDRLGGWYAVADEVGAALSAMGAMWAAGVLTIADEHVASDTLQRALSRVGDALPSRRDGPRCVLACAGDDPHTLGLSLAELCIREVGWTPLWLGQRVPPTELIRTIATTPVSMVALSASIVSTAPKPLADLADQVGRVCVQRGVTLVLGGTGAWPDAPVHATRLRSFHQLFSLIHHTPR